MTTMPTLCFTLSAIQVYDFLPENVRSSSSLYAKVLAYKLEGHHELILSFSNFTIVVIV